MTTRPRRPASEVPAFTVADWPERECKYCGESFKPRTRIQVRCSRTCHNPAPAGAVVPGGEDEPERRRPGRPPAKRELIESIVAYRRTGLSWARVAKLHRVPTSTAFRLGRGMLPDVPQPAPDRPAR